MNKKRYLCLIAVLSAALIISASASLTVGPAGLSVGQLIGAMRDPDGNRAVYTILCSIRFPRMLAALIGGAGLSLSGVILQSVTGNPLAGPNTIGVNAGAGLAAVICLYFFPHASGSLPVAAFFGAFITLWLILSVARASGNGKATVIMAGIACTSLFQAIISFITVLDTDVLSVYSSFSLGSFSGVSSEQLAVPGILVFICFFAALSLSGRITALSLGDTVASSLGIRVGLCRTVCLMLASLSAASVISYAGLLGFVGLVVPHMARRLAGNAVHRQITVSALLGAILLLCADLIGRTLFSPSEISVGILMAMIGAPFFFILLLKRRHMPDA